jgi:hypothetical protein
MSYIILHVVAPSYSPERVQLQGLKSRELSLLLAFGTCFNSHARRGAHARTTKPRAYGSLWSHIRLLLLPGDPKDSQVTSSLQYSVSFLPCCIYDSVHTTISRMILLDFKCARVSESRKSLIESIFRIDGLLLPDERSPAFARHAMSDFDMPSPGFSADSDDDPIPYQPSQPAYHHHAQHEPLPQAPPSFQTASLSSNNAPIPDAQLQDRFAGKSVHFTPSVQAHFGILMKLRVRRFDVVPLPPLKIEC